MKTKRSVRNLILPESLALYLQNLKKEQDDRKKELGPYYDTKYDGFVCVDQFGKLHSPNYVTHAFKKVIRQNNLPDIRFHDLRHSCATMLLSLGISMKAVQEQLGHTQSTTMLSILLADWFATLNFVGGCAFGIWGWNEYGNKVKSIWKNLSK